MEILEKFFELITDDVVSISLSYHKGQGFGLFIFTDNGHSIWRGNLKFLITLLTEMATGKKLVIKDQYEKYSYPDFSKLPVIKSAHKESMKENFSDEV